MKLAKAVDFYVWKPSEDSAILVLFRLSFESLRTNGTNATLQFLVNWSRYEGMNLSV